jgi:UDP-glucuronate 4-epimerase
MKILITGVAGFIGFHIAKDFLNNNSMHVYGIDNFDNYYSTKYKKFRVNILKKNKKFYFKNLDIRNNKKLRKYLDKKKFDYVFHMAAQAGVRFSYEQPEKYINTNIYVFLNLLKCLEGKVNHKIFYASSSSVYGDTNKFPTKELDKLNPKNIYGVSKMLNERTADFFSRIYNYKIVGLRFFTVYGEWGRPDMFFMKLLNSLFNKSPFYLNNNGKHERDFTYIKDVINIIKRLMVIKLNKHEVFNICSSKPINIKKIIKNNDLFKNIRLRYRSLHKADVLKTHGSNSKLRNKIGFFKFTNSKSGILETFNWYKRNEIYKIF